MRRWELYALALRPFHLLGAHCVRHSLTYGTQPLRTSIWRSAPANGNVVHAALR